MGPARLERSFSTIYRSRAEVSNLPPGKAAGLPPPSFLVQLPVLPSDRVQPILRQNPRAPAPIAPVASAAEHPGGRLAAVPQRSARRLAASSGPHPATSAAGALGGAAGLLRLAGLSEVSVRPHRRKIPAPNHAVPDLADRANARLPRRLAVRQPATELAGAPKGVPESARSTGLPDGRFTATDRLPIRAGCPGRVACAAVLLRDDRRPAAAYAGVQFASSASCSTATSKSR